MGIISLENMTLLLSKFIEKSIPCLFCLMGCLILPNNANAQTYASCKNKNAITEEMDFIVRSVRIEGKWIPNDLLETIKNTVNLGERYSPANVSDAQTKVSEWFEEKENNFNLSNGAYSILYVDSETCDVSDETNPKQVEIVIHPYSVRVDLLSVGNNVLPIPRVNTPSFSTGVPSELLATLPVIGILADRNYSESLYLQTTTDLLNLPPRTTTDNGDQTTNLNLNLSARRSLTQPFYNLNTGLEYTSLNYSGQPGKNVSISYGNRFEPLGEGQNWREQVQIEAGIQGRLDQSFFDAYALGSSVRLQQNIYNLRNSDPVQNSDIGLKLYALGDSRIGNGFGRMGVWFDSGFPSNSSSYQRLAVRAGYATELGDGHNTIGLEIIAGSGYAWGNSPEYSRFFGGNSVSNYLYEQLGDAQAKDFPSGPILRSFGEQQVGLRGSNGLVSGGNFYWHINLNLTFPIAQWSKPLIPDIEIDNGRTLRSILKGQVNTAINSIAVYLEEQGYSSEEAENQADRIVKTDIAPTVNYIADHANIYSIKPMLLFDAAQISGNNGLGSTTWAAIGAGIQVNIINGSLETGYMQTIAPASDSSVGNFFLRLVLHNFP